MSKYICSICSYTYDEAAGSPSEGIAPGTKFEDVPSDWVCPLCTASNEAFNIDEAVDNTAVQASAAAIDIDGEMSFGQLSALFSNLARSSEKQYHKEESALLMQLSDYFARKDGINETGDFSQLGDMIASDLSAYTNAKAVAQANEDRGALRSLVWSEKVTKILSTVIKRYDGDNISKLQEVNIYVCEICGFVSFGKEPPEICPVCKVPKLKIAEIKRRKA